jgi:hypothetical protein
MGITYIDVDVSIRLLISGPAPPGGEAVIDTVSEVRYRCGGKSRVSWPIFANGV